ncbi:alanine--tRNA ligase [Kaistia dalseonensis]|uniref:Alanine--tRNA ligase n=1 Tax=Kaistia dalseonensis TaxID=410840 RepID=A0ABU0HBL9_9HYPH|nr:alanine--tRNA ligase [Kaistia dalseonensis]MCX5497039.1 alanine--tRNA ligase [Kaistia dalseonensis]MDQ0439665.1 alanyl-tRNA synthetase [Kaistia dalseonensis]
MSSVNDIRSAYLGFFQKNGHEVVPSSPLVPRNDPTLMFTNAGMVQFKDYFTGRIGAPYPRATTSQKCVRAGGKHNDLDNVGYTARHHTFFEMLGNFSFGDYFKERAIELAWTLITKEFGLPKDKLLVTVYHTDDEAFDLWKKIAGLADEKIIRIPTSDNFWQMGDTGPCGPCSEIFYDHGDHIPGGPPGSPEEDGDRFIEIWNLVFMQYEQIAPGNRVPLPKPSIDTGMGLERVAAVLQGVHDNYDIDLFRALIRASVEATGVPAEGAARASHRIIADHLRASSFLIADGVLPSNEGRGYVLRRIMRRAMRHAHILGAADPLLWRLVPALVREMGQAYPELVRAEPLITETLRLEEIRFRRTLARGLTLLDEATSGFAEGSTLDGETAFKLYDTYGFPLDLTQDALRARGIGVDTDTFQSAMERQKAEARANWSGSGDTATETVWYPLRDRLGATEFLGYSAEAAEGKVLALVRDGAEIESASAGEPVSIVVNQTPFYGESGGQVGDAGRIETEQGAIIAIEDTQKKADGLFVHIGKVEQGTVEMGDAVRLSVDHARRGAIRSNHSATHLLHAALRTVLGDHVAQKGSLVAPDRLRFDFSHPKPIDETELGTIEDIANAVVLQDAPVVTRLMDRDEAMGSGAMALFGEKYGDEVRVVTMGERDGKPYSVELCGGTHVGRTGEIGLVTLVGESAVAAGVRRVEALTGKAARDYLETQDKRLKAVAAALKVRPEEAAERVAILVEERRRLEKELADAKKKLALGGGGQAAGDGVREVGSVRYLGRVVEGIAPKDLKGLVDDAKKSVGSGIVAFVGVSDDGKAALVVGVSEDLLGRYNAVDLVRAGSEVLGGKGGGGRPDMAQAGGPDGARAGEALAAIETVLAA